MVNDDDDELVRSAVVVYSAPTNSIIILFPVFACRFFMPVTVATNECHISVVAIKHYVPSTTVTLLTLEVGL